MTTIAFSNGIMCADSQVTLGSMNHPMVINKLLTTKEDDRNLVYGFCGNTLEINRVKEWIKDGKPELTKLNLREDSMSYLCWDGEVLRRGFICDDGYTYEEIIKQEYFSIGSGSEYALGAMEAGASAEEAVRIAIKYDIYSGGDIVKSDPLWINGFVKKENKYEYKY